MPTLILQPGEVAIAAYGSLCSRASLQRTLGRAYDKTFFTAELAGWRRCWDMAMPNPGNFSVAWEGGRLSPRYILYLNVRRAEKHDSINVAVFSIHETDLPAFDRREWGYERVRVNDALRELNVEGGDIFVYTGKPECLITHSKGPHQAALRQTYIDIVSAGLAELGDQFIRRFWESTDPIPRNLVIP
jgi:hypothetical protein